MSTQPMTVRQVGYPDFWPVVLDKHKKLFIVTQNLGPTIDDLFSVAHTEPLHKVGRHLAKMIANSIGAVLLLGMNGYTVFRLQAARLPLKPVIIGGLDPKPCLQTTLILRNVCGTPLTSFGRTPN